MENKAANLLHGTRGSEDSASQGHWPEVLAALKVSNYERVADLLRVIDTSVRIEAPTGLIQIALQVCLACIHCNWEIEWHGRARQEADERERELRQGLETILAAIINAHEEQGSSAKQLFPHYGLPLPSRQEFPLVPRKSPAIWKRIQAFLRFRPKQASNLDQENRLPPVEGDHLIAAQPKQEETPGHAMPEDELVTRDSGHEIESQAPLLVIYCLGTFRMYQNEQPIEDWPNGKGKSIFKYLLTHRERPIAKDILMDLFWPDADADSARNNLNVAIYGLRQALRNGSSKFSHVLFQNDSYQLNPELTFWIDYEAFMNGMRTAQSLERQGELANAIREFTTTEALYQGAFLEEDRYEDWLLPQRQRLQEDYLSLLNRLTRIYYEQHDFINCANFCLKMLAIDPCCEEAHRHMMLCYYYQGQVYLALRQYHICFEALKKELEIGPSRATRELYELIRSRNGG